MSGKVRWVLWERVKPDGENPAGSWKLRRGRYATKESAMDGVANLRKERVLFQFKAMPEGTHPRS